MTKGKLMLSGLFTFYLLSSCFLLYVNYDPGYAIIKKSYKIEKKGLGRYYIEEGSEASYKNNNVDKKIRYRTKCVNENKKITCITEKYYFGKYFLIFVIDHPRWVFVKKRVSRSRK